MTFGQQLKDARTSADLTQQEAAKLLGISKSTLEKWEYDTNTPHQFVQNAALEKIGKHKATCKS